MDPSGVRHPPRRNVPENPVSDAIPLVAGRSSGWRMEAGGNKKNEDSGLKPGSPVLPGRVAIVRKRRFAVDLRTQSRDYS